MSLAHENNKTVQNISRNKFPPPTKQPTSVPLLGSDAVWLAKGELSWVGAVVVEVKKLKPNSVSDFSFRPSPQHSLHIHHHHHHHHQLQSVDAKGGSTPSIALHCHYYCYWLTDSVLADDVAWIGVEGSPRWLHYYCNPLQLWGIRVSVPLIASNFLATSLRGTNRVALSSRFLFLLTTQTIANYVQHPQLRKE